MPLIEANFSRPPTVQVDQKSFGACQSAYPIDPHPGYSTQLAALICPKRPPYYFCSQATTLLAKDFGLISVDNKRLRRSGLGCYFHRLGSVDNGWPSQVALHFSCYRMIQIFRCGASSSRAPRIPSTRPLLVIRITAAIQVVSLFDRRAKDRRAASRAPLQTMKSVRPSNAFKVQVRPNPVTRKHALSSTNLCLSTDFSHCAMKIQNCLLINS